MRFVTLLVVLRTIVMTGSSAITPAAGEAASSRRLFYGLLLLTCGTIMAMDRADADLWGHVQYGRELIHDRALPTTSTWNHTAIGYRWINHENLAEILLAGTYDSLGAWGLSLGKLLLSLLVIHLLVWPHWSQIARAGNENMPARMTLVFVAVVVAMGMEIHWHFRPQIFGYTCAAGLLAVLTRSLTWQDDTQFRPLRVHRQLWLAVPILLVWANTHGGFLAGLCILWAYMGMVGVHLVWCTGTRRIRDVLTLTTVACAATLATLVNPYGWGLHLWLWEIFQTPFAEIVDWGNLPLLSFEAVGFWVVMLTTMAAGWLSYVSPRRRELSGADRLHWPAILLIVMVGVQSMMHVRHLPFLVLTWGFLIPQALDQVWKPFREELAALRHPSSASAPRRSGRPVLAVAWAAYLGVHLGLHLSVLKVDRHQFPVDAFSFLARHRLEGRTIVTFNWAQYAIGLFADQELNSTVAFDGRFNTCYPQTVIDTHFDFIFGKDYTGPRQRSVNSPAIDPARALREQNPEVVIISRLQRPSVNTMQEHAADWTLLYQDGLAQIWGRADIFDDVRSDRYFPPAERTLNDLFPTGFVSFPAFPHRAESARMPQLADRFAS